MKRVFPSLFFSFFVYFFLFSAFVRISCNTSAIHPLGKWFSRVCFFNGKWRNGTVIVRRITNNIILFTSCNLIRIYKHTNIRTLIDLYISHWIFSQQLAIDIWNAATVQPEFTMFRILLFFCFVFFLFLTSANDQSIDLKSNSYSISINWNGYGLFSSSADSYRFSLWQIKCGNQMRIRCSFTLDSLVFLFLLAFAEIMQMNRFGLQINKHSGNHFNPKLSEHWTIESRSRVFEKKIQSFVQKNSDQMKKKEKKKKIFN